MCQTSRAFRKICYLPVFIGVATNAHALENPFDDYSFGILEFILIVVVIGFLLHEYFVGERCPQCKKKHAMSKTGKSEKQVSFFMGKQRTEEWKCRFCGHTKWKPDVSEG